MKKISLITACVLVLVACNKDFGGKNVDKKHPSSVPSHTLFSNAQKNLAAYLAEADPNTNVWRLWAQQWTQTTYTDESRYDLNTRAIPDQWWTVMYKDCLRDLDEARKLIPEDVTNAGQQKNQLAIVDIHMVYVYWILVNTFGNIPYTTALDADNLFPSYESAKTIYDDLLNRLNTDIANLDAMEQSFGANDLVYGGDPDKWKKFANSLKLLMGIMLTDEDFSKATSVITEAAPGAFTSNDDNAVFTFLSAPPNTNPVWANLVQSGRNDFVAASTLTNMLKNMNDPRLPIYFTKDAANGYSGGTPGNGNNYGTFSHVTEAQEEPNAPFVIMDYAQVEFALAETVARGINAGGTAEEHYNAGVIASIESWGGTAAQATTYLNQAGVKYAPSGASDFKQIATQQYIALYNRGIDAWNSIRRLDYPVLPAPVNALSAFPVRFTYPVLEQNVNTSNYDQAAAAIGGDAVTTKLFWDKH